MSPFQLGVFGHVKKTANSEGLHVWIKKKKKLRVIKDGGVGSRPYT